MTAIEMSYRVVGFTGTRKGLTDEQAMSLRSVLRLVCARRLHHGDCVGADAQADAICAELEIRRVAHPMVNAYSMRAHCKADEIHEPLPSKVRNTIIAERGHLLIVCPSGPEQAGERSGTWQTYRLGMRLERPICIIWPSGAVEFSLP